MVTKKIAKQVFKWFLILIVLWLFYLLACAIFPPLHHKKADAATNEIVMQPNNNSERIRSIDTNREALLWRLRLINEAKEHIVLTTFDFRDDHSGKDIMSALLEAADRDVKVQLFIDGINGQLNLGKSESFHALINHPNIEAKFYNPINLIAPWVNNYRMHDKYLIVDDFAYILGGRNTNNLFLGEYSKYRNEDRDILVYETKKTDTNERTSLSQLKEYFHDIWNLSCSKPFISKWDKSQKDTTSLNGNLTSLRKHYDDLKTKYPEAFAHANWMDETMEVDSITLHTNPIEAKNKTPLLWNTICSAMEQGNNILIQTPYIICSGDMYKDIEKLCNDGKQMELLINSVEIGSNPFGCTDYLNQKKKLHDMGLHINEYLGAHALHTKTVLVDDNISIVGSCNIDMRSIYLDTEMMLLIDSKELNEQLRAQIDELKDASRQFFVDGTIVEGENCISREQEIGKKLMYGILRIVTLPIRHLL